MSFKRGDIVRFSEKHINNPNNLMPKSHYRKWRGKIIYRSKNSSKWYKVKSHTFINGQKIITRMLILEDFLKKVDSEKRL